MSQTDEIKFWDFMNNEITKEQSKELDEYQKVHFESGILIKSEAIRAGSLVGTTYMISDRARIQEILSDDENASFELSLHHSGHSILEELCFKNKILTRKKVYVSNSEDDLICKRRFTLDEEGNELKQHTDKYYYENGELRYEFEYYQDGSCLRIYDSFFVQNDIFGKHVGNPRYTNFTWSGFEFYEFADPLFPE